MKKLYIFGHMNPDTDSVCAAITLANLKRNMGQNAEERILGDVNKETKYALNYFGVKEPKYLNDVKLQIKDLNYRKDSYMHENSSIEEVYNYMIKESTTGVPIVNEEEKLVNLITAKEILNKLINIEDAKLETSYNNILNTLRGEKIVEASSEIKGKITAASFAHSTFENSVNLSNDDIIIVGDRHYIIDLAIKAKVKLIIIVGNSEIKENHIKEAINNKVNIIRTKLNTFETSRIIMYSNYIKKILSDKEPYVVKEKDYYTDFEKWSNSLKLDNFPVIDKNGKCKGLLRKSEIDKLDKKKVVLVDHNELEQSAIGLEEAEITEIVDHHKIGKLSTNSPINFRNMIVGSTNTIIYHLYKENNMQISWEMAGLMLSGILSDTLILKSPTTTEIDKKAVEELNKICNLNIEEYGLNMFKAGTSLEGRLPNTIINEDAKTFTSNETKFMISQTFTMDYESILNNMDEYVKEINKQKENLRLNHFIFVVTDIIKNGSYIMYDENSKSLVEKAWNKEMHNGSFVESCVSRKQQIVPLIINAIEK